MSINFPTLLVVLSPTEIDFYTKTWPIPVVLMDRGYYSRELCEFLSNSNLFYVFRLKNNPKFLKAFKTSKKRTVVIDLNDNLDTDEKLLVRILRFRLETGEYEYLATNLFDRKYPIEFEFSYFYKRQKFSTEKVVETEKL